MCIVYSYIYLAIYTMLHVFISGSPEYGVGGNLPTLPHTLLRRTRCAVSQQPANSSAQCIEAEKRVASGGDLTRQPSPVAG